MLSPPRILLLFVNILQILAESPPTMRAWKRTTVLQIEKHSHSAQRALRRRTPASLLQIKFDAEKPDLQIFYLAGMSLVKCLYIESQMGAGARSPPLSPALPRYESSCLGVPLVSLPVIKASYCLPVCGMGLTFLPHKVLKDVFVFGLLSPVFTD